VVAGRHRVRHGGGPIDVAGNARRRAPARHRRAVARGPPPRGVARGARRDAGGSPRAAPADRVRRAVRRRRQCVQRSGAESHRREPEHGRLARRVRGILGSARRGIPARCPAGAAGGGSSCGSQPDARARPGRHGARTRQLVVPAVRGRPGAVLLRGHFAGRTDHRSHLRRVCPRRLLSAGLGQRPGAARPAGRRLVGAPRKHRTRALVPLSRGAPAGTARCGDGLGAGADAALRGGVRAVGDPVVRDGGDGLSRFAIRLVRGDRAAGSARVVRLRWPGGGPGGVERAAYRQSRRVDRATQPHAAAERAAVRRVVRRLARRRRRPCAARCTAPPRAQIALRRGAPASESVGSGDPPRLARRLVAAHASELAVPCVGTNDHPFSTAVQTP